MNVDEQSGLGGRLWVLITAGLLVVAGVVVLGMGLHAQQHAPQPTTSSTPAAETTLPPPDPPASGAPSVRGPVLPASAPTALSIPSIGVNTALLRLGLDADQTIQVPPQSRDGKAGWYRYSPSPGEQGPAVILGHVDSARYGPGVFFKLGALRTGATVKVTRRDGLIAVFRVERVVSYRKDHFPTLDVYGNTDHAALRLITCGGKFDFSRHSYQSNIVAYASLMSSHRG